MLLELREDMQERVRTTSRATIGAVSLLGEGAIDITASTTGEPIPEGATSLGRAAAAARGRDRAGEQGIAEITALMQDIRAGKGTVGKLMTDEQLYVDLHQFICGRARSDRRAVERQRARSASC